jgi:hypothetical protein
MPILPKKQQKNYVGIVLDKSTSMEGLRDKVINVFNHLTEDQVAQADANGIDLRLSLYMFADAVDALYVDAGPKSLTPLSRENYKPAGWTALMDGVKRAVDDSAKMHDATAPHVSHLIMVLTDGYENRSRLISQTNFTRLLADKQATGDWTFAFYVPPGNKKDLANSFGVPMGNIMEWEQSAKGVDDVREQTVHAASAYYASRAAGVKMSSSFFVKTDLSNLTPEELRKKLDDVSGRYKSYAVTGESEIREFVENATGKPYPIGRVFYQLSKTEKIQDHKQVLLQEKGKKALWGGAEARQILGLPDAGEARVMPGNHANYDIFVQSTSTNRKLVRGTKVWVER